MSSFRVFDKRESPLMNQSEDMRIQQEFHDPSNCLMISFGKGSSKSSGTQNSPAHRPNGRSCLSVAIGLSSATGLLA